MRSLRSPHTLVILSGYGLGAAALIAGLPEQIPPSWIRSGGEALWLGGPMVAFLLPTAMAITDALLRGLAASHPVDEPDPAGVLAIYDAIMLRFMMFVVGVHATVLAGVLGLLHGRAWAGRIVPILLGVTLISVGNLLPRTRPNLVIGIRTHRMLADRALWIRTHRSAGYLVVTLGFVLVLSALAIPAPVGPGMILLAGPAALVGTCVLVRHVR
jgi:SdpI/YfhL protein family